MQTDKNTYQSNGTSEEATHDTITKRFQSRSEAAQDIISRQPGFLEKWALILFLAILIFLIIGTWFIRYPDIIEASGTLTAENAPKEIIPLEGGRLIKLFVTNGDKVKKDEMIGWIESTANTEEILDLSDRLDSCRLLLQSGNVQNVSKLFVVRYKNLGEIQTLYQSFITAWQQYNDYVINGFYDRKKEMLMKDIATLHAMNLTIKQQKELAIRDNDSSKKSLAMNKILLDEKVISPEEYRVATSAFINKARAIPQYNTGILSNENEQRSKLKELEQLDHDAGQKKIIFDQALQTLKSSVDEWKRKYILQSPLAGTIFFSIPLQKNKFIQQGKLLGYVNPDNTKFFVEMNLPLWKITFTTKTD